MPSLKCKSRIIRLLFVYIKTELDGSTFICGLCVFVTTLPELPVFHYATEIFNYLSHDSLFHISMASQIIRFFGYSILTPGTIYYVLFFEFLHGFTFAACTIVLYFLISQFGLRRSTLPKTLALNIGVTRCNRC